MGAAHSHVKMIYQHLTKRKPREFYSPQDFLIEVAKYFEWCDDHPLLEEQVFQYQGSIVRADKGKVRPYTKRGLATFLAIPYSRLKTYSDRGGEWADAVEMVEQVIYTQKFENAAANLLNAGMISRDLGLADRNEITGADGGPIQTDEVSARERIASKLAILAARGGAGDDTGEPE